MSRCPYHRSDFCVHAGQTTATTVVTETPEAEPSPVTRCASCTRPAIVTVTVLPRPLPLFGSAVRLPVCQEHYPETKARGQVLKQRAIVANPLQS